MGSITPPCLDNLYQLVPHCLLAAEDQLEGHTKCWGLIEVIIGIFQTVIQFCKILSPFFFPRSYSRKSRLYKRVCASVFPWQLGDLEMLDFKTVGKLGS